MYPLILQVFKNVGDTFTVSAAMASLIALLPCDPNATHKAKASLGGASNGGTIVLVKGAWTRV